MKNHFDVYRQNANLQRNSYTFNTHIKTYLDRADQILHEREQNASNNKEDKEDKISSDERIKGLEGARKTLEFLAELGQRESNPELIQLATIADASAQMTIAGMQLMSGSIAGAAMLGPIGIFGSAALTIFNTLKPRGSQFEPATMVLIQHLKGISEQVKNMHGEMRDSFAQTFENQRIIIQTVCEGFSRIKDVIRKEVYDLKVPVMEIVSRLESNLNYVSNTLMDNQQTISLQPLAHLINRARARLEETENYDAEKEAQKIHGEIADWIKFRGHLSKPIYTNASRTTHLDRKIDSDYIFNNVIRNVSDNTVLENIGYLSYEARRVLNDSADEKKDSEQKSRDMFENVFEESSWLVAANHYVQFREKFADFIPDNEFKVLDSVVSSGKNQLEFIQFIQRSNRLFQLLFQQYESALNEVKALADEVVSQVNNEQKVDIRRHPNEVKNTITQLPSFTINGVSFISKPQNEGIRAQAHPIGHLNYSSDDLNGSEMKQFASSRIPFSLLAHKLGLVSIAGSYNTTLESFGYRGEILRPNPDHDRIAWIDAKFEFQYSPHRASLHPAYSIHIDNQTHRASIGSMASNWLDGWTASYYVGPSYNGDTPPRVDQLNANYWQRKKLRSITEDNISGFEGMMQNVVNDHFLKHRKYAIGNTLFTDSRYRPRIEASLKKIDASYRRILCFGLVAGFRGQEMKSVSENLWSSADITRHLQNYSSSNDTTLDTPLPFNTMVPQLSQARTVIFDKVSGNDGSYFQRSNFAQIETIISNLLILKRNETLSRAIKAIELEKDNPLKDIYENYLGYYKEIWSSKEYLNSIPEGKKGLIFKNLMNKIKKIEEQLDELDKLVKAEKLMTRDLVLKLKSLIEITEGLHVDYILLSDKYKSDLNISMRSWLTTAQENLKKLEDTFQKGIFVKPPRLGADQKDNDGISKRTSFILQKKHLRATKDSKKVYFSRQLNSGVNQVNPIPGSCGFISLATTRTAVMQAIASKLDDTILGNDIKESIGGQIKNDYDNRSLNLTPSTYSKLEAVIKTANDSEIKRADAIKHKLEDSKQQAANRKRGEDEKAMISFLRSSDVINEYLDKNLPTEWMGSRVMRAWAIATNKTVRIWGINTMPKSIERDDPDDLYLQERESFIARDSKDQEEIDVIHTGNHYERLKVENAPALVSASGMFSAAINADGLKMQALGEPGWVIVHSK